MSDRDIEPLEEVRRDVIIVPISPGQHNIDDLFVSIVLPAGTQVSNSNLRSSMM
jgi:hypothetical protein